MINFFDVLTLWLLPRAFNTKLSNLENIQEFFTIFTSSFWSCFIITVRHCISVCNYVPEPTFRFFEFLVFVVPHVFFLICDFDKSLVCALFLCLSNRSLLLNSRLHLLHFVWFWSFPKKPNFDHIILFY